MLFIDPAMPFAIELVLDQYAWLSGVGLDANVGLSLNIGSPL